MENKINSVIDKLAKIQQELHVPKNKENTFSGFKYRSADDILENLKPLLVKHKCVVHLSDQPVATGDMVFLVVNACITDLETGDSWNVSSSCRHEGNKKGFDDAQVSGGAISYGRKYALGGLFLIDNEKDPDSIEKQPESKSAAGEQKDDTEIKKCPTCSKQMVMRSGNFGDFWGCSDWKTCGQKPINIK